MTAAKARRLLKAKLAQSFVDTAEMLGVGRVALEGGIKRGAVPVISLGKGSRRRTIPSWWIAQQLQLEKEKAASQ